MKNNIYILFLIMLSGTLAACSNETNASNDTQKTQIKSSAAQLAVDKMETKDTAWLEEKALYKFEATEGSIDYAVYLYAEDEQNVMKEESGSVGKNQLFTGTYFFYLADKASSVAFKQAALVNGGTPFKFNPSLNQAYSLKLGKTTVFAVHHSSEQGNYKPLMYAINDGEIVKISSEEGLDEITGTEIKTINQKYLQTAHLQENKVWKFSTWEFNGEALEITKKDESTFDATSRNVSEHWYKRWSEKKELYYPFHNIELSHDMVEKAKQGIPLGSPYPIGTNIANIKKSEPNFMEEGLTEGTPYLMYPEITYYYEQATGTVTAVSFPGERVKTTMDEIKKLLGNPEQEEINADKEILAVYNADKYVVKVLSSEDGKVKTIYLSKK
ncbi:hypothetical protein RRV45_04910 [Bacillus sp. DTU_2020_1000418_1_SI_GHA_SEK_038]|uniref:hypothetical protein n=1 Tax=Bacillus sp. DTU_2020_1000418_1_SI_GHA_SEK_038 TaxID=3077585 RepID=UPI0028ECE46F|nr:hypothetical protein [Bacillus sp. DTU_2020_1000418_1_SI_GHA_SEK_038]WNS76353.1 hypothetical protein RRV45_04910 [Bacillus sp. DTU_2020_1000418_1_SI_GHA_SEK_038]